MVGSARRRRMLWLFAVLFFVAGLSLVVAHRLQRVSRPGEYRGYSRAVYDSWVRTSQYVAVRDGNLLAVDIYRPTRRGRTATERLPVLWSLVRYHRADSIDHRLVTPVSELARLQRFLRSGYVVGIVDVRGSGASFGTSRGPFSPQEALDAYDITEWLAAQPWCDGNVGMFGRSYMGTCQYLTAGAGPPHLKAIFPEMAMFDLYDFAYPGGIMRRDFGERWSRLTDSLDTVWPAAPVDRDTAGIELRAAMREHQENVSALDLLQHSRFRDAADPATGENLYVVRSPASMLPAINRGSVAVYVMSGWFDMWPRDAILWYLNLRTPRKLLIGPWSHTSTPGFSLAAEQLRWFDHWLKGIDNGVMDEPPIYYHTIGAPRGREWRASWQWPPPGATPRDYYLRAGTDACQSDGGHCLDPGPPAALGSGATFRADSTATSGAATRWTNGYGGPFGYPDLSRNDAKGASYTSARLDADLEVTGHPIVSLWVACAGGDVDIVAYLEDVGPSGRSDYVSEGCLRASHRDVATPPYANAGIPHHPSDAASSAPLPPTPTELVFDMHPTSFLFRREHRIRVTVTTADRDNLEALNPAPAPMVTILDDARHASRITLSVVSRSAGGE